MFRTSMCPSAGGNYCIYATLLFFTLYGWRLVCWLDWNNWVPIQPEDQTSPIQSDKYQCRIDTVISSWWWSHGCAKHVEKRNKYIKHNCAPNWTYLQEYTGMHCQQNLKFVIICIYLAMNYYDIDIPAAWILLCSRTFTPNPTLSRTYLHAQSNIITYVPPRPIQHYYLFLSHGTFTPLISLYVY